MNVGTRNIYRCAKSIVWLENIKVYAQEWGIYKKYRNNYTN